MGAPKGSPSILKASTSKPPKVPAKPEGYRKVSFENEESEALTSPREEKKKKSNAPSPQTVQRQHDLVNQHNQQNQHLFGHSGFPGGHGVYFPGGAQPGVYNHDFAPAPFANTGLAPYIHNTASAQYPPYLRNPATSNYAALQPALFTMGDYQNTTPPVFGVNYQPPVPDTTNGPMNHTYVPRFDGQGQGQVQVPVPVGGAYIVTPVGSGGVHVCAPPPISFYPPQAVVTSGQPPFQQVYQAYQQPFYHSQQQPAVYYPQNVTYIPGGAQPVMLAQQQHPFYRQPGLVQQHGVIQQQPGLIQQPVMVQGPPVMMSGQTFQAMPAAVPAAVPAVGVNMAPGTGMGMGVSVPVITTGNYNAYPDIMGVGKTGLEVQQEQIEFAYANELYESQDFKPADDNPSRFYFVREVDGNWTQRNRFTIENLGDCRWYITGEGYFYAVRKPN